MKRILFVIVLITFSSYLFAQRTHIALDLVFEPNQTELSEFQKEKIAAFLRTLRSGDKFAIYPLTYNKKSRDYYYAKVSRTQAEVIREYMTAMGMVHTGTPGNFPSGFSGSSVRVNLTYYKEEDKARYVDGEDFPEKPSQFFTIDPNKDTILTGDEGTVLYLKAGALKCESESECEVEVELKEYYDFGDYIKEGLATTSNGRMISTGGTIYLDAKEKESKKQVSINKDIGVGVDFTKGKDDPDMEVFVLDPNCEGCMNWVTARKGPRIRKGSWTMTETLMDHEGNILAERVFHSREEWEAYLNKKRELRSNEEKLALINQESSDRMNAKLKVYDLGMINCDKFMDEPMEQMTLAADPVIPAKYFLVYEDVRGVMQASDYNGFVSFGQVPKDRTATLVAYSFVEGKSYFFKQNFKPATKSDLDIKLKEVPEDFVDAELAKLK